MTLKKAVLDPQGEAVKNSLHTLGYERVRRVRVGKYIEVELEASGIEEASAEVEEMARRLLSNPVIEDFSYEVEEVGA